MSLGQFGRLGDYLADPGGDVQIELQFRRGKGQRTLILGDVNASVVVVCQYCLEQMTVALSSAINLLVVDSTEALLALPQGQDGVVCETEMLTLGDVVEDELIVSLPMVPRHAQGECVDLSGYEREGEEPDKHRPFAGREDLEALKQQLKRNR